MLNSKLLLIFVVLFAVVSCKNGADRDSIVETQEAKKVAPDTVWMIGVKFQPETITVNKGDTIVWINKDIVAHNVTVLPNEEWTSGDIEVGGSWKMVIEESFDYYCTVHPPMKGKVEVK